MAEVEIRHPDGRIEHPAVRYEKTDASLPAILAIIGCSMALGLVIFVVVHQFFVGYERHLAVGRQSAFPLAPTPTLTAGTIPEPRLEQLDRLEGDKKADVYSRQKAKEDALRRYGKTDETGYVHIPIDEAIKHLAGKLPVRKEQPGGERHNLGLIDAGEPNSGRLFRKEPR